MARFKPPPLARPPVDGQMRGEYGDSVPGTTGLDAGSYHARLWFGSSKGTPYSYEVYAVRGHIQVWASGETLVKAKPLSNTPGAKAAVEGLKRFMGREGLSAFRAAAEESGAKFDHLRTEHHIALARNPSLRASVWKAAHRLAATCLHDLGDPIHIAEVPLAGDDIADLRDSIVLSTEEGKWWGHLTEWARFWIALECLRTIRWMLDSDQWPIERWLAQFATFDWRGRAHGYQIRPERGRGKRSCFDVLGEDWIRSGSNLVLRAEKRANAPHPQFPHRKPRPWVQ